MGGLVLLYHRVHPKYGVSPEVFREQMAFLSRRFRKFTIGDFRNLRNSFLITFDDGFYDFFAYAYPVLKEFSIPALLFVSPERVLNSSEVRSSSFYSDVSTSEAFKRSFLNGDNSAFLSWGELRLISSEGLVSVQSHALTHRATLGSGKPYSPPNDWRIFSLPEEVRGSVQPGTELTSILIADKGEAERELSLSKSTLEEKLGREVNAIAWPWGIYDEELIGIARRVGYKFCFTTERGWNRGDFCRIKRLAVSEKKGMFWFKTRTLLYSL